MGSDRGVLFDRALFAHVNSEMPVSPPRGEVKYISQGWSSEELSEDMGRKDGKSEGSSLQRWWLTVLSLGREENHIHKEEPNTFQKFSGDHTT